MTMTRLLLSAILLAVTSQAAAATLYRWVEKDGSITFSPEPPPAGVTYETVDTGGAASARPQPRPPQDAIPTAQAALPNQGLSYAPSTDSIPQGITRGDDVGAKRPEPENTKDSDLVVGSSRKYAQCQDLKKRVTSLEQRLRAELTPDQVDNTVVAIVRYQSSFNQHCRR